MYDNKDVEFESNSRIRAANIPLGIWGLTAIGSFIYSYFYKNSFLASHLLLILGILFGCSLIFTGIIGIVKKELAGMGKVTFQRDTALVISLTYIFIGILLNIILIGLSLLNLYNK